MFQKSAKSGEKNQNSQSVYLELSFGTYSCAHANEFRVIYLLLFANLNKNVHKNVKIKNTLVLLIAIILSLNPIEIPSTKFKPLVDCLYEHAEIADTGPLEPLL
jgi:hypothetical protein